MNKIFKINPEPASIDVALLVARIGIAGMMLTHGLPKLAMLFSGEPVQFPGVLGMGPETSLVLAVFSEVLCSILILLGLATRLATIPLIVTMMIAVFVFHAADPFASQELGLLYLFGYLVLLILGSGKFSLDAVVAKKKAY